MHISYMYYRTIYVYNDILIYIPISDPRFHIKYGNRLIAASLESFPEKKKCRNESIPSCSRMLIASTQLCIHPIFR